MEISLWKLQSIRHQQTNHNPKYKAYHKSIQSMDFLKSSKNEKDGETLLPQVFNSQLGNEEHEEDLQLKTKGKLKKRTYKD